jgi:hypothetical protein
MTECLPTLKWVINSSATNIRVRSSRHLLHWRHCCYCTGDIVVIVLSAAALSPNWACLPGLDNWIYMLAASSALLALLWACSSCLLFGPLHDQYLQGRGPIAKKKAGRSRAALLANTGVPIRRTMHRTCHRRPPLRRLPQPVTCT